jgi:host factor-I protein
MKKILQDVFLRHLMDNRELIHVFLMNGIKLQGCIENFDEHVIVIKRKDARKGQLVFKQVISTIALSSQTQE